MAAPKTTVWDLEPHTAAKHAILRRYLGAWLPILSQGGFPEIAYVDAFAGPGRYSSGEDGSPIIALKALLEHTTPIRSRCRFHFVELDPERADVLQQLIDEVLESAGRPRNIVVTLHRAQFERAYEAIRSDLTRAGNIPTLAFIDPFGWTGMPLAVVEDLVRRPSNEVFINFMFEEINRFLAHPDQVENFDALFGSDKWKKCAQLSGQSRNNCLRDSYGACLEDSGAKYVRYFEMRNSRNATDYYLFFATKSFQGLKKMKEAMWKVDEAGQFQFSDATDQNQIVFFNEPQFDILKRQICQEFANSEVSVDRLEQFVVEKTAFRETHFKLQVLKPMEAAGGLMVTRAKDGRRRGTFPSGTSVRFP